MNTGDGDGMLVTGKRVDGSGGSGDESILEDLIDPLTTLFNVDNVLLICIIELMVNMLANQENLKRFRNPEIIEAILNTYGNQTHDQINKRMLSLLIELMADPEIIDILIEQHCLEVIVGKIEQARMISIHQEEGEGDETPQPKIEPEDQDIKIGYWDCLKILSSVKHEILPEFRKYGVIEILVDELDISQSPFHQMSVLEILINISMNDQNAVQVRESGIHIIGRKLLYPNESKSPIPISHPLNAHITLFQCLPLH